MAGINFVRRWVMGQMTKKADDGIMITLPDSSKVDLNVNITMDRLLRNGIDPDAFTNPQQVDNAINMINSRMVERVIPANSAEGREITEKIFGKQKAPVFDLEGNRIPEGSGIMGGKSVKELMDSGQVSKGARGMKKSKKVEDREMFEGANKRLKTEAQLKKEIEASNKKGIAGIKKRQLTEDEYQDFLDEVGGADQLEAYNFDGTVGDAQRIVKEQKEYMDDMFMEYKKGNLDPVAGDKSPARKKFLQNKLDEMEASGDKRLMTTDEIEELSSFDLGSEMDVAKSLAPKMVERLQLKQKYPGITDDLLDKILIDDNVQRKAEVIATMDEALKMMEKGKGSDEIIETFKNVTRTKQAAGGLTTMLGE